MAGWWQGGDQNTIQSRNLCCCDKRKCSVKSWASTGTYSAEGWIHLQAYSLRCLAIVAGVSRHSSNIGKNSRVPHFA
jgi:hypothetical protein